MALGFFPDRYFPAGFLPAEFFGDYGIPTVAVQEAIHGHAADNLVLADGFVPRDIALDPTYAAKFSSLRGTTSEQKLYPNFRLGMATSELEGHNASVSNTVRGTGVLAVDTKVMGFVGDFSAIRWGVQKQIGLELIKYGDPDGGGDLKRKNQVAFRAEVVYGWGIANIGAFAVITDPSSS